MGIISFPHSAMQAFWLATVGRSANRGLRGGAGLGDGPSRSYTARLSLRRRYIVPVGSSRFNAALTVNLIAALAARLPWRVGRTGFVAAHLGVVILLGGCLLSWLYGSWTLLPVVRGTSLRPCLR